MMLPGTTISPPYFLTPSRRPRLSRPLREEPPAFLCAIRNSFLEPWTAGTGDRGDAQHRLPLAMALLAPIILLPLLLEDDDLGRPALLDLRGADQRTLEQRRPGGDLGPLADHQHLGELDRGPGLARELLDRDDIVLGDLVLLAAGPDHSEHDTRRYGFPRAGRNRREGAGSRRTSHPVREPRTIGAGLGLSRMPQPAPILPAVREDSRKKSNRNAKSAWFIAGKARIINYLRNREGVASVTPAGEWQGNLSASLSWGCTAASHHGSVRHSRQRGLLSSRARHQIDVHHGAEHRPRFWRQDGEVPRLRAVDSMKGIGHCDPRRPVLARSSRGYKPALGP